MTNHDLHQPLCSLCNGGQAHACRHRVMRTGALKGVRLACSQPAGLQAAACWPGNLQAQQILHEASLHQFPLTVPDWLQRLLNVPL